MGYRVRAAGRSWSLHEHTLVLGLDQVYHEVLRVRESDAIRKREREKHLRVKSGLNLFVDEFSGTAVNIYTIYSIFTL